MTEEKASKEPKDSSKERKAVLTLEMNLNMYAVVRFLDESGAPGIVSMQWVNDEETSCLYPNVRTNEARDKLLRKGAVPHKDWNSCRIKILHKYESFSVALQQLRCAEDTSSLESEHEELPRPRRRGRTTWKYPGEDSDEDFYRETSVKKRKKQEEFPYPVPPANVEEIPYPVPQTSTEDTPVNKRSPTFSSNPTLIYGKLVELITGISMRMSAMESKMDLILENQAKLILESQCQVPERTEENLEVLGSLPLVNDDSFMNLNAKISEENHLRHLLMQVLISVGGKDMRSHIFNMLKRILSDDVAELYSLYGKSSAKNTSKKPFLATPVSKSIFAACQKVYKDEATELKIKEAVGDWLCQAKVRNIRRMQRFGNTLEKNAESLQHNLDSPY